jgi:hypothetical protein
LHFKMIASSSQDKNVNLALQAVPFLITVFNLCKNLSLNTQEIKLPSPESNPKSILHWSRFFRPSYLSDPAFPCRWSLPLGKLGSSNIPHSDF